MTPQSKSVGSLGLVLFETWDSEAKMVSQRVRGIPLLATAAGSGARAQEKIKAGPPVRSPTVES